MAGASRLVATPLAAWERDGLKVALLKLGLPADDVGDARLLFWRFETHNDVPVGFGGLEILGHDALLRSVVILPPLRDIGMGRAIVATLESEAAVRRCRAIYLLATAQADFFARLGYLHCERAGVPDAIRDSAQFTSLCPATAQVMVKRL